MGKISTFGLSVAAIGLFASPVSAQSSMPKNAAPSVSASAPKAARSTPVTAEDRALAMDIILAFSSEKKSHEMMNQFFAISPEQFMSQSPQMRSMDKKFPGIVALLLERMQVWINSKFDEIYQGGINAQVESLAKNMTTEQLRESKAFFGTDAGKAFIAISLNNVTVDEKTVSAGIGRKLQRKDISAEDLLSFDDDSFLQQFGDLPEDQVEATVTFLQSATGEQLLFAIDEAETARLDFVNNFIAANQDELEALTIKVFEDYENGAR